MKGWRFESHRHCLAAKGIKTGYLARSSAQINADIVGVKARETPVSKGGIGEWIRTRSEESKFKQELADAEGKDLFPNMHGLLGEYRRKWAAEDAAKVAADVHADVRAKAQPVLEKGDVMIMPKPEEISLLEQDRRN